MTRLIKDAQRFIMYHRVGIENSPLQAYVSALLFSPTTSLVRTHFQHEEPEWISIKPAMADSWSACLQTLEGHSNVVRSVAFSHNSTWLASASDDKTIKIWDVSSGACLQTLEGHSDRVWSVAFSHNSTWLASASFDKTIKIWDVSSGVCLQTLEGHSDGVMSVAFSHNSTWLASASWDKTIKIWDASTSVCLQTLEGHSDVVTSVAFSHNSTWLASASWDKTIKIWDVSSGVCLQTLDCDGRPLYSISFDATGSYLHTDIGIIAISPLPVSDASEIQEALQAQPYYGGVSSDDTWITCNTQNTLWLPSEYRPRSFAVSGRTVGIGVGSGRVWICSFSTKPEL
jgi:WD40 repeat protein